MIYSTYVGLEPEAQLWVSEKHSSCWALERLVRILTSMDSAWVEEVSLSEEDSVIKIVSTEESGTWVHVFQGIFCEITLLADVCRWFDEAIGRASDRYKEEEGLLVQQ